MGLFALAEPVNRILIKKETPNEEEFTNLTKSLSDLQVGIRMLHEFVNNRENPQKHLNP
jgi:hypothetical protein